MSRKKHLIEKINYSCEILNKTISSIFTDKINESLFNKTCQSKMNTLKKNNLCVLFGCIIGFQTRKKDDSFIIKELQKCLLYHFMIGDLKPSDEKEDFKSCDAITYKVGGGVIEKFTESLINNPENISIKLNKELFDKLLIKLFCETNFEETLSAFSEIFSISNPTFLLANKIATKSFECEIEIFWELSNSGAPNLL